MCYYYQRMRNNLRNFDYSPNGVKMMSTDDSMYAHTTARATLATRRSFRKIMEESFPRCLKTENPYTMVPFAPSEHLITKILGLRLEGLEDLTRSNAEYFLEWTGRVWVNGVKTKEYLEYDQFYLAAKMYLDELEKIEDMPAIVPFYLPPEDEHMFGFSGQCQLRTSDLTVLDMKGDEVELRHEILDFYMLRYVIKYLLDNKILSLSELPETKQGDLELRRSRSN